MLCSLQAGTSSPSDLYRCTVHLAWCVLQEQEPRLPTLLKMLIWAHAQLEEKLVYPHVTDLATAELSEGTEP